MRPNAALLYRPLVLLVVFFAAATDGQSLTDEALLLQIGTGTAAVTEQTDGLFQGQEPGRIQLAVDSYTRPAEAAVNGLAPSEESLHKMLESVVSTRARFGEFSVRASKELDRLQQEFERHKAEIQDLSTQKDRLESGRLQERESLRRDLEDFKNFTRTTLMNLQAHGARLEHLKGDLTKDIQVLSRDLEAENSKKKILAQKLRSLAVVLKEHLTHWSDVEKAVQQKQEDLEKEVDTDMHEVLQALMQTGSSTAQALMQTRSSVAAKDPIPLYHPVGTGDHS